MATTTLNNNRVFVKLNTVNNFRARLNLQPPIVGMRYCRMIPTQEVLIRSDMFKPTYQLREGQRLEEPVDQVLADMRTVYNLGVSQIDFQTIELLSDNPTETGILFEFYDVPPPRNTL